MIRGGLGRLLEMRGCDFSLLFSLDLRAPGCGMWYAGGRGNVYLFCYSVGVKRAKRGDGFNADDAADAGDACLSGSKLGYGRVRVMKGTLV